MRCRPHAPSRAPSVRALTTLAALAFTTVTATAAAAHDGVAELPPHFELVAELPVVDRPVALAFADDGRLMIASKRGRVSTWKDGVYQPSWVLDLAAEVLETGDRGLLGFALHPGWVPDGGETSWMYLAYTASGVFGAEIAFDEQGYYSHGMVTRYRTLSIDGGPLRAVPTSREVLLGLRLPDGTAPDGLASLHNSHSNGALAFAPDGTLLVAVGDGAHWDFADFGGQDPEGFSSYVHPVSGLKGQIADEQDSGAYRARDLRSLAGKLLRIDPATGLGLPSNPHFDGDPDSLASRIWATGFRNPFRFALRPGTGATDPAVGDVGQIYVGDVGNTRFEEIDVVTLPGRDYGWPLFEGLGSSPGFDTFVRPEPNPLDLPDSTTPAPGPTVGPAIAWDHSFPNGMHPLGLHVDQAGQPGGGFTGACVILGDFYAGGSYPDQYDGELFFSDFGADWLRTAAFDAAGNVTSVRDFGTNLGNVVTMARDPLSGDLFLAELGLAANTGRVLRLRYGANLSPVAALEADVTAGLPPLDVAFDASASSDPENDPLSYRFDFGDGTPPVTGSSPTAAHTYTAAGSYNATVTVTDDGGLGASAQVTIAVGSIAPTVAILAPTAGAVPPADGQLALEGTGSDPLGGDLTFDWRIDLYHDTHVHPEFWTDSQSDPSTTTSVYSIAPHAADGDLYYYDVVLTATAAGGASASTHVWAIPGGQQHDPVSTAVPISRVDELVPPMSLGLGNPDIEVIRDGVAPPAGTSDPLLQFDTEHNGDQGDDDWIGFELVAAPEPQARFTKLVYREGAHTAAGGWFEDVTVEVRVGGNWVAVQDLVVTPPWPSGDPGPGFEEFVFDFAPTWGDALRLRGTPGGSVGFVSCSELHGELLVSSAALPEHENLAGFATIISALDALTPPTSLGAGNPDPETVRNGTVPAPGSTSLHAQHDHAHGGDQGDVDWIGYAFAEPRTVERVVFVEGVAQSDGGWLDTLTVEGRLEPGGPWTPLAGAVVDPPYRGAGPGTPHYERWSIDFPPTVLRELRVVGQPGGSTGYLSVAELEALGPWWNVGQCGYTAYGTQHVWNTIQLASATPPLLGYPGRVEVTAADPSQPGGMLVGASSLALPIGPSVLLVDPASGFIDPFLTDPSGSVSWAFALPAAPALSGVSLYLQAASLAPTFPGGLRYSHGLELAICE